MTTPLIHTADTGAGDDAPARALRSLVLCATPGAGEEVVAGALAARGGGSPRAWFDVRRVAPALLAQWDLTDLDEYIERLHHEFATPDGMFGIVLYWHDVRRLHRQVAGLRQPTAQRILDVVEAIAPDPTFVRISRADRAAHALALHGLERPDTEPASLTTAQLALLRGRIDAGETVWSQWFDAIGVKPHEVVYDGPATDLSVLDDLVARMAVTPPR